MAAAMMPTKAKKKRGKVEPLQESEDTELHALEISSPPSTSDFEEFFDTNSERDAGTSGASRPVSGALTNFTEETNLLSAGNSTGRRSEAREADDELASSRSSTPSSAAAFTKKLKKNTVLPINEETTFTDQQQQQQQQQLEPQEPQEQLQQPQSAGTGQVDPQKKKDAMQSWSEGLNEAEARRLEDANGVKTRGQSVPFSPKLFTTNRVTPLPSTTEHSDSDKVSTIIGEAQTERPVSASTVNSKGIETALESQSASKVDIWSRGEQGEVTSVSDAKDIEGEARDELSVEAVLAPPKSSGEHEAYIPMDMAKECIARVIEDMKKMKANHYRVVEQIQEQYKLIEEESQVQFNDYVLKLRDEYKSKVAVFKNVIESQQSDFNRKQKFYEEAIKSLRDKNHSLLLDKRQHLLKAKETNEKHEEEKNTILNDLAGMCDKKHKDYVVLRKLYNEEVQQRDELHKANEELHLQISALTTDMETLQGNLESSQEENKKLLNDIAEKEREEEEKKRLLEAQETEYSSLQEEKGALDTLLTEKDQTIEAKEREKEEMVELKEKEKDQLALEKEEELKRISEENEKTLEERDKLVLEKENDLEDKSKIIEELEARIAELERPIPALSHTTSTTNADVSVPLVSETGVSATVETAETTTSAMKIDTVDTSISATAQMADTAITATAQTADTATSAATLETIDAGASAIGIETSEIATSATVDSVDAATSDAALGTAEAATSSIALETTDTGTSGIALESTEVGTSGVALETVATATSDVTLDTPAVVSSVDVQEYEKKIGIQEESLRDMAVKLDEKQVMIEKLDTEIEQLKQNIVDMEEKHLETVHQENDSKNETKMELLKAQEKNRILHARLEMMLNEVADSVDIEEIQGKLQLLVEAETESDLMVKELTDQIKEWEELYMLEHDGLLPGEEERPDDITDIMTQIRSSQEQLDSLRKNMTVMNMLLDGTLPDDMKQGEEIDNPYDAAMETLKEEHKKETARLEEKAKKYKKQARDLDKEKSELKTELKEKESEIKELESRTDLPTSLGDQPVKSEVVTSPDVDTSEELSNLKEALSEVERKLAEAEAEQATDAESHAKQKLKLEKKLKIATNSTDELTEQKRQVESELKVAKDSAEAELKMKQDQLDEAKAEIESLKEKNLAKIPAKPRAEIKALQEKLVEVEQAKGELGEEVLALKRQNSELNERVTNTDIKVAELQGKEVELEKLQEIDKKYKDLKVKFKKLEAKKTVTKPAPPAGSAGADPEEVKSLKKKLSELEKKLAESEAKENAEAASAKKKSDTESKVDSKAMAKLEKSNEVLKGKVDSLTAAAKVDADKIKDLDQKLKDAAAKANDKNAKKQEKAMKDLQKKLETEEKQTAKFKENLEKEKSETARLTAEVEALEAQKKKDHAELAKLGVAAAEGLEAAEKVTELTKSNKSLTAENKVLAENFNSERILRKKYYNMVEDMKGKIRVYCRARPMSRSELDRGNYNIVTSPDEYTAVIQSPRGPKDFQYDAVFTPEHTQENVFEDTSRLIQSAVDGYNVCIFAYGQTGSGKTFTMIGDKEQNHPGIAPRSFTAIYELIEENSGKFSFATSMYMMELYRDNLIDLFADAKNPAKLDIKKDKKGMVVVTGAIVNEANSAEELMSLFEKGSASRHIASTKMNAESSRSHLVLSIIIESTNLTSGAVVKGKLSIVDLAGSERAAKTGATPEQLKEAQSINKSLSALGDVISALSSEQAFIPYRNNKLTMLMQDSLGGNAKTLMFVNISPADYNCDETITSLTYASRVKLITNDASKNAEGKEIARLKGVIAKLKKGENVDEEDLE